MYLTEIFVKEDIKFMKFKKSHILLISLISLFLILCIGAASAAGDADSIAQDMSIDDISATGDIVEDDLIDANVLSGDGEGDTNPTDPEVPSTGENDGDGAGTPTTINAGNETYSFGSNITFDVSVSANDEPINVSEENLKVSYKKDGEENNFTDMNFTLNNESQIVFKFLPQKTLSIGDYIVKIQFLNSTIDGVNYTESETEVTLNITKSNTTINASDVKIPLGSDIIIPLTIKLESNKTLNVNASNITVLYIIDDDNILEYNVTNATGGNNITKNIKLINPNFTEIGNYTIVIKFLGTNNCYESNKTITLSILENNTFVANDTVKVNNSTRNVTIPFYITNSDIINITDEETGENTTTVNVTNLTVEKEDIKIIVSFNNETINLTGDDFNLSGEPGNYTLNFNLTDLNFTVDSYQANITIVYKEGDLNETNKTIGLTAFADVSIVPIDGGDKADYQFGQFKFQLVDGAGNPIANYNVTLSGFYFYSISDKGTSLSTSKTVTTDENGTFVLNDTLLSYNNIDTSALIYNFNSLPAGKYNLTFNTGGFFEFNNKTEITVNKINAEIKATNMVDEYGKIVNYAFQLVRAGTNIPIKISYVQFAIKASNINAVRNATTNMTGWYTSPDLNLTAGVYNLTLSSLDSNLICSAVKKTLTLNQRKAVLTASNRTIYYNSGVSTIVKLTDKKTGKAIPNAYVLVRIYTTSKKYSDFLAKTDKNGKVQFTTPLSVGKHKIIFQTVDNNYAASKITRYITVKKAAAKFTGAKVSTYYRSGKYFQIKLTNTKNKNVIIYATVNIKVYISKNKYYNYTGTTNEKGIVKLKTSYKPGTYKVVVSSADKGYSAKAITRQIKIVRHSIRFAPVALKVKKGKYFKVKVISKKNKKVLSGVKVKIRVYTGKKFKTYTRKTNKKGIASLKISQKVGKHKVVIMNVFTKLYTAKKVTKTLRVTKK